MWVGTAAHPVKHNAPAEGANLRSDSGFALADALTGLTILAATIALSINVASLAQRASAAALGYRHAALTIQHQFMVPFDAPGTRAGTAPMPWRTTLDVDARLSGSDAEAPCRWRVTVSGRSPSRPYTAATLESCPEPEV